MDFKNIISEFYAKFYFFKKFKMLFAKINKFYFFKLPNLFIKNLNQFIFHY